MENYYAGLLYQYKKLAVLHKGIPPIFGGNINFELDMFFIACYHFKDWIKHDPTHASKSLKKRLEKYVYGNFPLRVCGDLCHAHKHRVLTDIKSGSLPGSLTTVCTTVTMDPNEALVELTDSKIFTSRGQMSGFKLADQCMMAWNKYLEKHLPAFPVQKFNTITGAVS
jgi:hypothetical protein